MPLDFTVASLEHDMARSLIPPEEVQRRRSEIDAARLMRLEGLPERRVSEVMHRAYIVGTDAMAAAIAEAPGIRRHISAPGSRPAWEATALDRETYESLVRVAQDAGVSPSTAPVYIDRFLSSGMSAGDIRRYYAAGLSPSRAPRTVPDARGVRAGALGTGGWGTVDTGYPVLARLAEETIRNRALREAARHQVPDKKENHQKIINALTHRAARPVRTLPCRGGTVAERPVRGLRRKVELEI